MKLRVVLPIGCPCNCIYCYKEGMFTPRKNELNLGDLEYLIKKARMWGIEDIEFTGGEPTDYPFLKKLISGAKKCSYNKVIITTIGAKLADKLYCLALKEAGLNFVNLTVNSFNRKVYKKMMNSTDELYEKMRVGLENAIEIFGDSLVMNVVLTSWNIDTLPEIFRYASNKNSSVKILEMLDEDKKAPIGLYFPPSKFKEKLNLPSGEMINPVKELIKFENAKIYLVNSCCPRKECSLCRKGHTTIRITPDGKLKTCIANELGEINILKEIKSRNQHTLKIKFNTALDRIDNIEDSCG